MIDLKHLRTRYHVVTVREYLELHGQDPNLEWSNGAWHRELYHASTPTPTLAVIRNHEFDPSGTIRVDRMPPIAKNVIGGGGIASTLTEALGNNVIMNLEDARNLLKSKGMNTWTTEQEFEDTLDSNGFVVLHTFAGA